MQAKLSVDGCRDLYSFWGGRLAQSLASEASWILNLASKEYSRAILPHLSPELPVVTCVFGSIRPDGKVVEKGTLCKMARGEMVRWLAEQGADRPEALRDFDRLDYRYRPELSREGELVFVAP